ncbi:MULTISPECIES: FAD-binding oxidoreductase [Nocardioides]|uniref:FAD-binding oxidoreductase n=1 Tax=Nocardioides vastitatis TaxID=2568655 RepID=A0ABW0ZNA4_9ACTN|nr:FAD-binding oxidoreductase [Nocardioides sp.]THJ06472.1 FAD-binding oxidoreductase [Nocardioides sp.]
MTVGVGEHIDPGSAEYDDARSVFNAMIDKRPAVIARCASAADVAAAIRHAREQGLEIAVRGGGHSVAGMSTTDGGLVVDLRAMSSVDVDVAARTVRVSGGATMSHLDRALEPHGLVAVGGRVSTTGVGGFTLGGGTGWLDRKFGLACDNLLSVELVTADGELVTASEDENSELFWALHGGGGNFGVATSLTFRVHELRSITACLLLWEPEAGEEVLRAYRDLIESGPDEASGGAIYLTGPPEEFVPEQLVGNLTLLVLVTFCGTEADARSFIAPLLALSPAAEVVMELPYAELQCMLDDPPGLRNYWSAEHLASFPDEAVSAFTGAVSGMLVPSSSQHVLFAAGGAAGRKNPTYPLPWRSAPWVAHPFAMWTDPEDDERAIGWTRAVRDAVRPWSTGAVYLNFIGDEGADRVRAGFGTHNWDRLVAVKREFDPENVFRLNHNVDPS